MVDQSDSEKIVRVKLPGFPDAWLPLSKVPANYILVEMHYESGRESEMVYIEPTGATIGEVKHPPLTGELLVVATNSYNRMENAIGMSLEEWLEGFRTDLYIEKEIQQWDFVSKLYEMIVDQAEMYESQKPHLLNLLVRCLSESKSDILVRPTNNVFTPNQKEWVIDQFFANYRLLTK